MPEVAILMGVPGAGKTSFYRAALAPTHVHLSRDLLPRGRAGRVRELALLDEALGAGRSVAVDDVNAAPEDRAPLIAAARRHGAAVVGYLVATPARSAVARNRARTGPARVADVAVFAAAKRFQPPRREEGFGRLLRVDAEGGRFDVVPHDDEPPQATVFLLSPASTSGARAALLFRDRAASGTARRLRSAAGAPLGEVFAFLSALYFRGKLAYATRFARPPAGLCGAFVVTPGDGLRDPAEPVTLARLRRWAEVPVAPGEPRYLEPLLRDARALAQLAGPEARIVLLGSVASTRYVEPLLSVFGERLLFPPAFVGRGDLSRGGLLLRAVAEGRELDYAPLAGATRTGPRAPRLPRPRRRVRGAPGRTGWTRRDAARLARPRRGRYLGA